MIFAEPSNHTLEVGVIEIGTRSMISVVVLADWLFEMTENDWAWTSTERSPSTIANHNAVKKNRFMD